MLHFLVQANNKPLYASDHLKELSDLTDELTERVDEIEGSDFAVE